MLLIAYLDYSILVDYSVLLWWILRVAVVDIGALLISIAY